MNADERAIRAHVHSLFDAYLRKDRAAIRAGHTADWRGFPIRARHLVRGIDEYMREAEGLLQHLRAVRYEMLDMEVQVHGDLRARDVYRREPDGAWNQCGSNICALPE
jgi:ketosteroid isomerase-like protein